MTAGMREPYPTDLERRQFSRSDKMTATPDGDRRLARRLRKAACKGGRHSPADRVAPKGAEFGTNTRSMDATGFRAAAL